MIYDYVKADEMMARLAVDPIQFHLLFLLYHKIEGNATTAQIERFKHQVLLLEDKGGMVKRIDDLIERGLIDNWNTEGVYGVDRMNTTPYFDSMLIAADCGQELWDNYPATCPLSDGSRFISRFGDKDAIISKYERKIRKDAAKHKFVMLQLSKFVKMVNSGKINGMKIQNFVDSEMWDVLGSVEEGQNVVSDHGENL
jgi:hypothetical protein